MNKVFTENAWKDYLFWQEKDRKTLQRVNRLIADVCRNPLEGIGKPEALSGNLSGFWSRRINERDRLIYKVENGELFILACRTHYYDH